MDVYDGLGEIHIPEESEQDEKRRAIIKSVLSIFLVLLLVTFLIPADIFSSIIEGKKPKEDSIQLNQLTIMFTNNTYEDIQKHFLQHQLTEFKLCLQGTVNNSKYLVTSYYQPEILFASPVSVHSRICDQNTIIDLHSHPFRNCLFSDQDIISHTKSKQRNPETISAIMCDYNRFSFLE
ncbi:MAG TPA: hypothetical protein VKE88_00435 [Candidatus Nanoarchaeia archaeon]|nr:hypothetical protein [Candidatus Nanoarchaeia archaeon]